MPPLPLTICWPRLAKGRVLFVVFAYHGRDRDDQRRGLLERRESPSDRGHRIVHRDHYANPRPLPYVLAMVASAAEALCDRPPDVILDTRWEGGAAEIAPWCATVERADLVDAAAWTRGPLASVSGYDHVVFVYPDALGLGCGDAEREVLARHASVLIVNGRRRGFRLDGTRHGQLRLHRWLAHTRIVERLLGAMLNRVGLRLARRDHRLGADV
jgi:hypothetical protein